MIINVGSDITRNILAAVDTPILQKTNAIVYGLCTDNSYSCGYKRGFDAYIQSPRSRNLSRYMGDGGVMYCENVHIMRIHFTSPIIYYMEFMKRVLECIRQTCINHGLQNSRITELNYLTVNDKKVIGCAYVDGSTYRNTTVLVSLNLKPFNIERIKDSYISKRLINIGDLSDTDIPDNFIDIVANDLGSLFGIDSSGKLDPDIFKNMKSIHNSQEWILNAERWW